MSSLFNADMEQRVLGAILMDSTLYADVAAVLSSDSFCDVRCANVFTGMNKLAADSHGIDFIVLADTLEKTEPAGDWISYLGALMANTMTTANLMDYVYRVADYHMLRKLHAAGMQVCKACHDPAMDVSEKIAAAQSSVLGLLNVEGPQGPSHVLEAAREWWADVERAAECETGVIGVSTGYNNLDARLGGMREGELYIIAARPKQGKTVLALNMAAAAFNRGHHVLFFSLEMARKELVGRIACAETQIPYDDLNRGYLTQDQCIVQNDFIGRIRSLPFFIDDKADLTIAEMRARARAMASKQKLGLILVDYLQLVGSSGENENVRVNAVSRGLKQMGKELRCPVVVLSQMNRSIESRADRRPMLSDLRGSGGIEQDADCIMFIHYPTEDRMELITAAFRRGQSGSDWFEPQFELMRFVPSTPYIPPQPDPRPYSKKLGMDL